MNIIPRNAAQRLIQSDGGFLAGVAERCNIGTRAKLVNALAALKQAPESEEVLKRFYAAFNKRADQVFLADRPHLHRGGVSDRDRAAILQVLLGAKASHLLPRFAALVVKDEANSVELLSIGVSAVPGHLEKRVSEVAKAFYGFFSQRSGMYALKEVLNTEFSANGFIEGVIREREAIQTAALPEFKEVQAAFCLQAKREALGQARKRLFQLSSEFSGDASKSQAKIDRVIGEAKKKAEAAVSHLEKNGVKALSQTVQALEGLIAAMEGEGTLVSESVGVLLGARRDLEKALHRLQKNQFTLVDVERLIQDTFQALEMLASTDGLFVEADAEVLFGRVLSKERSQVESGASSLKGVLKTLDQQIIDYLKLQQEVGSLQQERKEKGQAVEAFRKEVAKEEAFFSMSQAKQKRQLLSEYERDLDKRMQGVQTVKHYLHIPTTGEVIGNTAAKLGKGMAAVGVLAALGVVAFNHSESLRSLARQGEPYLPDWMRGQLKGAVKGAMGAERVVEGTLTKGFNAQLKPLAQRINQSFWNLYSKVRQ